MSDVSFIRAAPAKEFSLERKPQQQPAVEPPVVESRAKTAAPVELPHKTKVMTEFRSAFEVAYTFIDPQTDQVVARWSVTPPMAEDARGAQLQHTL